MKGRARISTKHFLRHLGQISSGGPEEDRRARYHRPSVVVLLLVLVFAASPLLAQAPPADLHREGDHWTAWNPPVPPEGAQVHVIQPSDTLWDLAGTFLGDPYLWPQLWEANQYILDAHWIYPGDPLVVNPASQVTAPGDAVGEPLADAAADGIDDELAEADEAMEDFAFGSRGRDRVPQPLGTESQIYCSGYIGDLEEEFPFSIAASEYEFLQPTLDPRRGSAIKGIWGKADTEKYGLDSGDIVYLDGGRADGLSPGELLTAIEPKDVVRHPLNRENVVGRFYKYKGRLRILSTQDDTAIAEIVRTCDPIPVGIGLRLFEPEPVPLRRKTPMRPVNMPVAADELDGAPTIIKAYDEIVTLAQGYLVFVDRGEAQDVLPGDVFTIYRRGRRGFPPILLGEAGILSVTEDTALANILESRYTVFVGDALVLK